MAAINTPSTLNGFYKRVYGKLVNAVPECGWFLDNVPWDQGNRVGDSFHVDVILSNEQGYTYGGSGATGFTLLASVAMGAQPASVTPFNYCMRSQISYGAATRAKDAGPRAFASAISTVVKSAMESVTRRLEVSCHYGSSAYGIGRVAATAIVDIDSTNFYLVFAEDQWAPGIWQGAEGAILEAYDEGDALETTGGSGDMTVVSVDFSARRVKVSAASALITQIETKNDTEYLNIYFKGSHDNDMVGIEKIFSNTTGTIHGISAATYGLWAGNAFSCDSEQLTMGKVIGYAAQLRARGLRKSELIVEVNPLTWADLHQEQVAARAYDSSYSSAKAESGFDDILYHGPTGRIRVVSSEFVKGGEAFMFPKNVLKRIGSADREWPLPSADENPWHDVPDTAAAEIRIFADQTVFCERPAACAKISSIVNSTGTTGG